MAKKPKIEVTNHHGGVHVSMETESYRIEDILTLPEACQLFLKLGAVMHEIAEANDPTPAPFKTQAAIALPQTSIAVGTEAGNPIVEHRFLNFPTLRTSIPEDALRSSGEAMLQISNTPHDVRNQKLQ